MKYKKLTKRRSITKLYFVDKFRTSCKCSKCEGGKSKIIILYFKYFLVIKFSYKTICRF